MLFLFNVPVCPHFCLCVVAVFLLFFVSECKILSRELLKYSENVPHDPVGMQITSQAAAAHIRRLSDGYFNIYLPPIFTCLLSPV